MLQVHPSLKLTKRHTLKAALKIRGKNGYVKTALVFMAWRVKYQLWLWSLKHKVSGRWFIDSNDRVSYVPMVVGDVLTPPGTRFVLAEGRLVLTLGHKPWHK